MTGRGLPGLLVLVLAAGGCGGGGGPEPGGEAAVHPGDAGAVHEAVRRSAGRVVLVNVWATWCQPCREEMPDLLKLRQDLGPRGFDLVLVSADFEDQRERAARYLAGLGVDFPTLHKTGKDQEFIDALNPEWTGSLPATFVYDRGGALRRFWEGKASYDKVRAEVEPLLGAAAGEAEGGSS